MGVVVTMTFPGGLIKKLKHFLFDCPSFWTWEPKFKCSQCDNRYRCYWQANDCYGHVNVCNKCYKRFQKELGDEKEWDRKRYGR